MTKIIELLCCDGIDIFNSRTEILSYRVVLFKIFLFIIFPKNFELSLFKFFYASDENDSLIFWVHTAHSAANYSKLISDLKLMHEKSLWRRKLNLIPSWLNIYQTLDQAYLFYFIFASETFTPHSFPLTQTEMCHAQYANQCGQ